MEGGVVKVPAGIVNAAPPVFPEVPKTRFELVVVVIVPDVLTIGLSEVWNVRVFAPIEKCSVCQGKGASNSNKI